MHGFRNIRFIGFDVNIKIFWAGTLQKTTTIGNIMRRVFPSLNLDRCKSAKRNREIEFLIVLPIPCGRPGQPRRQASNVCFTL
jgi:hypothetical protein